MLIDNHFSPLLLFSALVCILLLSACSDAEAANAEIEAAWQSTAHADAESRAFTRWNDEDPPEIPTNCAKCHSTFGYRDFLGLDGASPGQVDNPVPVGTTIECEACHNEVTKDKDSAIMPSGKELTGLAETSSCLECHQGRASGADVDEAIAGLEPDSVNKELSLPNVHNNPAGPIQYGSEASGGYEFPDQEYLKKYGHVIDFDSCSSCHDAHTLQIDPEQCSACHLGVKTAEDFHEFRTGNIDYDGDGDISEGMSGEIKTMREKVLLAIRLYAAGTDGAENIDYDGKFVNAAGENYATWTPRMLQAGYNYEFGSKDPGSYAHNGLYIIQLLYDSINGLGAPTAGMTRPSADQ